MILLFLVNYSCSLECIEKIFNYSYFGSYPRSIMFFKDGVEENDVFYKKIVNELLVNN